MIRREGHDPLHYTISRRGKKLMGGSTQVNELTSPQPHTSGWETVVEEEITTTPLAPLGHGDHDYDDGITLMYRSEEDSPNDYESSSPSEEEKFSPAAWQSVIRFGLNDETQQQIIQQHPAKRG